MRALLLAGVLLFAPFAETAHAGEIAYDLDPPTASDSAYCGAGDAPLNDFDHYLVHLYRCGPFPPLVFNLPANTDSVRFTVANGITGWTQVWTVDHSGNVSCGYRSHMWASPAVPDTMPQPPPADTSGTGITGKYYSGRSRSTWIATRRDTTINFTWGSGSPMPGVPVDEFSAEWIGRLIVPVAGAWTLYLEVDDGGQVYEGIPSASNIRIDHMGSQPLTEWSWSGNLIAGEHGLAVVYQATTGNAEIHLKWSGPGVPKQVVPRSALR